LCLCLRHFSFKERRCGNAIVVKFLQALRTRLRERHTLRAHFWQSLANYTQQGFGLVFGVILARILAPADFGAYAFALATVALCLLPAMWSLAPTLVADAGRTPNLHQTAVRFAWSIGAVRLIITGSIATWFFATARQTTGWLCLLIGLTESFRELNNVQKGVLEGAGRFEPNFVSAIANMLFSMIGVIPIALLFRGPYVLVLPGLGMLVTDFMIYRYFSGRSVFVKPGWVIPREFFHSGFWLWLNAMAEIGLARFDKWFVGGFRGDAALGHYNRAFGYAPLAFLTLNSFATNPTVSGLARCETGSARLRLFLRTAAILITGGIINWLLFFTFSREIVLLVFGPQWYPTIPIFRAFASLSLAYAIAYLPITALYAQKRFREVAIVRTSMLFVFVAVLFACRESASAIVVAWLLQGLLIIQGIVLLFLARPFFCQHSRGQVNA
jgi:O-antigen/teichoic acid export membrane protein